MTKKPQARVAVITGAGDGFGEGIAPIEAAGGQALAVHAEVP